MESSCRAQKGGGGCCLPSRSIESSGPSNRGGAIALLPLAVTTIAEASRAGRHTVDRLGPPPRLAFSLSTTLLPPTCTTYKSHTAACHTWETACRHRKCAAFIDAWYACPQRAHLADACVMFATSLDCCWPKWILHGNLVETLRFHVYFRCFEALQSSNVWVNG